MANAISVGYFRFICLSLAPPFAESRNAARDSRQM